MALLTTIKSSYGGFKYQSDAMFYNSGFCVSSRSLLYFRVFASIFHWLILIIRILEDERLSAFCYLTNIVYLCCALYYTVATHNTINQPDRLIPLYHKLIPSSQVFRMDKVCYEEKGSSVVQFSCVLQWLLHSLVLNMSILVSVMYFLLIYNPMTDVLGLTNISRHILNSVFILIEFTFNSIAVKFVHIIYGLVLSALYTVFTVLFYYIQSPPENYIYKIVNWDDPLKTGTLVGILIIFAIVLKALLVIASRLKFRFLIPSRDTSEQTFLV